MMEFCKHANCSCRDGWPLGLHFQEFGSQLFPVFLAPELLLLNPPLPLGPLLHLACPHPVQKERSPKGGSYGLGWTNS